MNKQGDAHKFFFVMILLMAVSLGIVSLWNSVPGLKETVNAILNPSAGALIQWNLHIGMITIVAIISIITILIQKYATDQETLRELKKEQKDIQKEMEKYKEHPEKRVEMTKKSFELMPKMMAIQMRGTIFTIIPFILLFRWFMDFFESIGNPTFLGFMTWFWFYLVSTIVLSSIFRKVFKVA